MVSDSTLTCLGLTAALADSPDVLLAAVVDRASAARAAVTEHRPDVVAVDVALPDEDGLHLAAALRHDAPERGVVLISPRDDDRLMRALEAGISAYVPTNAPIEVLLSAVRHAAVAPASFTAPDLAQAMARHRRQQQLLSPREGEVLRALSAGPGCSATTRRSLREQPGPHDLQHRRPDHDQEDRRQEQQDERYDQLHRYLPGLLVGVLTALEAHLLGLLAQHVGDRDAQVRGLDHGRAEAAQLADRGTGTHPADRVHPAHAHLHLGERAGDLPGERPGHPRRNQRQRSEEALA